MAAPRTSIRAVRRLALYSAPLVVVVALAFPAAAAPPCPSGSTKRKCSADLTAPSAPTGLEALAVQEARLDLAWAPSADDVGVAGYTVSRDGVAVATTGSTAYDLVGLTCGTSYAISVRAFDRAGNLSAPASAQFTTAACAEQRTTGAEPDTCRTPYDPASPWNRPVGANPTVDPRSSAYVGAIADNGLALTSDVDGYAIAIYTVDSSTPLRSVRMSGYFSAYDVNDSTRYSYGYAATVPNVPIPVGALAGPGTDGQVVLWDPVNGVEWGFWQFTVGADGSYSATNGYRYRTTPGFHGRFADGKAGRGAGTPYLAGTVRPCEIERGRIDHALAFAYKYPSKEFVYPASKSDGKGVLGADLPEGARLQLDPSLGEADFNAWGLTPEAKVVARALQTYGMYVIDNSGSSKVYLEARHTAGWSSVYTRNLLSRIPWRAFRVVLPPTP